MCAQLYMLVCVMVIRVKDQLWKGEKERETFEDRGDEICDMR